ncbi:MAG TPA: AAA family ATPase, partial [Candidatus Dormibacteraeota bacterium]
MLLAFRTGNFRSLRDETELSLMVPAWVSAEERVVRRVSGAASDRVGTVAGIYGANASGKSNVLAAMRAMCEAVRDSHQRWQPAAGAPYDPFLLDDEHHVQPTLFEVDLLLDGRRWQYGFRLDREGIVAEWLYAFPHGRKSVWFERERGGEFYAGKSLTGPISTLREITRPNSLFLSVGAANNHPQLTRVAEWLSVHVAFATRADQDARIGTTTGLLDDRTFGPRIQQLLTYADLGITRAEPRPDDALRSRFLEAIEPLAPGRSEDLEELADRFAHDVVFHHRALADNVALKLVQESLGTQTWFALLGPLALALALGGTLVVDELDASLHPQLTARLIQMFHDPSVNPEAAQLVFS